jgi:WD40 repeat protein
VTDTTPRLRAIYLRAMDIVDVEQRCRFVDECCSDDPELGQHVKQLLEQSDEDSDFMAVPAVLLPGLVVEFEQPTDEFVQPGAVIDRYHLVSRLGTGGMGTVFQARQLEPVERIVALKVLRSGMLTASAAARVEAERQTLADLKHPGIVSVLDAGRLSDGRPWFVMDYVAGSSLTEFCHDQRLGLEARLRLMIDLCDAVRHAHFRGIIHQDLKPSNVLVERVDGRPVCRLIDFGIRRDLHSIGDHSGPIGGTPDYMSPEQVSGYSGGADTRSDVFSLGRLLAAVVFGSPLAMAPQADAASQPLLLSPRRCRELRHIVLRATRDAAADRYASVQELSRDLQRLLVGRAVHAMSDDGWYRAGRFFALYKLPLSLAILTVFSLAAGLLISLRQMRNAQSAERRASRYLADAERQKHEFRTLAWNSAMQQAWTAWEHGRLTEVRRLLETSIPPTDADADRHAAWSILQAQLQSTILTRRICNGPVHELRAVPGKAIVAAACADGFLRLIRSGTGDIERELSSGIDSLHALAVDTLGRRVAVGGSVDQATDHSLIRIYDLDTNTWHDASSPQLTTIETLEFSGDGQFLLCGQRYENPIVLSTADGSVVTVLPTNRRNLWGAISRDGNRALVAAADNVVYLADTGGTQPVSEIAQQRVFGKQQHVLSGFLFGDQNHFCCLVDGTDALLLHDVDSQTTLASLEFSGKPVCARPGHDSRSLLLTTAAGEVLRWDLNRLKIENPASVAGDPDAPARKLEGEWIPSLEPDIHWLIDDEPVVSVCDQGEVLVAGTRDGYLHVMPRSQASWTPLQVQHSAAARAAVQQLTADRDPCSILLGFNDGSVLRLSFPHETQAEVNLSRGEFQPNEHVVEELFAAAIPPRPLSGMACSRKNDTCLRWLQGSGQLWQQSLQGNDDPQLLASHDASLESSRNELLRYSPDATQLAYSLNRTLIAVSPENTDQVRSAEEFNGNIHAFCWHPDGKSLLIGGAFRGLWQWFPDTGRLLSLPGSADEIRVLSVSSDSRLLVSGDEGGRVAVWDLSTGQAKFRAVSQIHEGEIHALCLLDGGRIAASADEHCEVVLWLTDGVRRLGRLAKLPGACLHGLDFLELFTTSGEDRLILSWLRLEDRVHTASWPLRSFSGSGRPGAGVVAGSP